MILKYIIIKNQGAILFPETITHKQVARGFNSGESTAEVESAGFAVIQDGKCLSVYGSATSIPGRHFIAGDEHIINDSIFNPSSVIKYYNESTQSVRERGAMKATPPHSMIVLSTPENWDDENIKQFSEAWRNMSEKVKGEVRIMVVENPVETTGLEVGFKSAPDSIFDNDIKSCEHLPKATIAQKQKHDGSWGNYDYTKNIFID